jgi:uracil-DNA glycosylase
MTLKSNQIKMGIKNLAKFLREKHPQVFSTASLSYFSGQKLALDSQLFLYKLKCANPERWKINTVYFLLEFRKANVHPVMVFEGKGPEAKSDTVQKRIEMNRKAMRRLDILNQIYADTSSQHDSSLLAELKSLGQNLESLKSTGKLGRYISTIEGDTIESVTSDDEKVFDDDLLETEIAKFEKRCVRITKFDQNTLRVICECLGIAWLDAPGESEEYCCELAKKGYVNAVLSDDSDCMVYGTPIWLSKFDSKGKGEATVEVLKIDELYEALNFTKDEFIKFCCLCGTDYVDNPPGLGPVKLYSKIKKEGFESLWEEKYDTPYSIFTKGRDVKGVRFCKQPTKKMLGYLINRVPEITVSIETMYDSSRTVSSTMKGIMKSMESMESMESMGKSDCTESFHITSVKIPKGWEDFFNNPDVKSTLTAMPEFDSSITTPTVDKIFSAFAYVLPEDITVCIIGQDPYHTPGVANGLAFSSIVSVQPSLKNIYKELLSDGFTIENSSSGDLTCWTEQGVFLVNTALTVEHGDANSHKNHWAKFTSLLFDYINKVSDGMVVVMWGKQAQSYSVHFDDEKHPKIMSSHPSPLGAHQGFIGSKPFSAINTAMVEKLGYEKGIDWNL